MKLNSPCLNCENREPGCHGKCREYNDWQNERLAKKREENAEKYKDRVYIEHHCRVLNKGG